MDAASLLLQQLNFRCCKLHVVGSMNDNTADELIHIRQFIMKLDYLLKQEALGNLVRCSWDESKTRNPQRVLQLQAL
jgi:hypothetical protein